jgi:hypothetical protein
MAALLSMLKQLRIQCHGCQYRQRYGEPSLPV